MPLLELYSLGVLWTGRSNIQYSFSNFNDELITLINSRLKGTLFPRVEAAVNGDNEGFETINNVHASDSEIDDENAEKKKLLKEKIGFRDRKVSTKKSVSWRHTYY